MNDTVTGETRAQVLLRSGSQGISQDVCREFDKFEQARQALLEDPKYSAEHKREQIATMEDAVDRRMRDIEDADIEAGKKARVQDAGTIAAELKGARYTAESQDPAAQTWALRQDIGVQLDLTLARELVDPATLADLFDESLASERPERIRRICPIVVQRLQAMAAGSSDETLRATARAVIGAYSDWTARNPSVMGRRRALDEKGARQEADTRERHRTTREKLKFRT